MGAIQGRVFNESRIKEGEVLEVCYNVPWHFLESPHCNSFLPSFCTVIISCPRWSLREALIEQGWPRLLYIWPWTAPPDFTSCWDDRCASSCRLTLFHFTVLGNNVTSTEETASLTQLPSLVLSWVTTVPGLDIVLISSLTWWQGGLFWKAWGGN